MCILNPALCTMLYSKTKYFKTRSGALLNVNVFYVLREFKENVFLQNMINKLGMFLEML